MRIHISFLAVLFVLSSFFQELFAQSNVLDSLLKSGERNLFVIQKQVEDYYKDKYKGRGSGYNQFKRWEYDVHLKVDSKGNIPNYTVDLWQKYHEYAKSNARMSALRTQSSFTGNWSTLGPGSYVPGAGWNGGIGRVNCVAVDPVNSNIIYAGTPAGGLWKSTTGGNSWIPLTDGMPQIGVSSIVIDPTATNTIYILTGDCDGNNTYSIGVLKSTDGGNTWYSTGLDWTNSYVTAYKLVMHPSDHNTLYVASTEGLQKTTDGGVSWSVAMNTGGTTYSFLDIEFKPGAPNTMYVSNFYNVYKTTDGGLNWNILSTGLPTDVATRILLAVSPANPEYLYVLYGSKSIPVTGEYGGLYRSTNSGQTFSLMSDAPNIYGYDANGMDGSNQTSYDLAIAVSSSNAEEVHVGGINCWKSLNGGQTWTITSHWIQSSQGSYGYTHADIHFLGFFGSVLYCGSDGGIFKSLNNASQWDDLSTGLEITQIYRIGTNPNNGGNVLYGSQDNGTNSLTNKVSTHMMGADGFECIVDPVNSSTLYGSIQFGDIRKSTDGGLSFYYAKPPAGYGAWLTPYVMSNNNSNVLFAGYKDIWKTEDGGNFWTNISNGNIQSGYDCEFIAVAPSNDNYIYVIKNFENYIYRTTNGGQTWENISSNLPGILKTAMAIHPSNPNIFWITLANGKVFKTTNGGQNWIDISGTLPAISINCIVYQNGTQDGLYVGSDAGVFYKDDNLSDWVQFDNGLPKMLIKELEISYVSNKLRAATYGRGLWESDLYGNNCPVSYTFTDNGTITGTVSIQASDFIVSNKQITGSSANVTYKAGNKVTLTPGFRVQNGNIFKASIGACGSSVRINNTQEVTGVYAGPLPGVVEATTDLSSDKSEKIHIYPNPFAALTNIDFTVDENSLVSISLFDMFGQELTTVVDQKVYDKGNYKVTFDGSLISNGIYYCILNSNNKKYVSKVVIAK